MFKIKVTRVTFYVYMQFPIFLHILLPLNQQRCRYYGHEVCIVNITHASLKNEKVLFI